MLERIFSNFENQKIDKSRMGENQTINGKTTEVIFSFFCFSYYLHVVLMLLELFLLKTFAFE